MQVYRPNLSQEPQVVADSDDLSLPQAFFGWPGKLLETFGYGIILSRWKKEKEFVLCNMFVGRGSLLVTTSFLVYSLKLHLDSKKWPTIPLLFAITYFN